MEWTVVGVAVLIVLLGLVVVRRRRVEAEEHAAANEPRPGHGSIDDDRG